MQKHSRLEKSQSIKLVDKRSVTAISKLGEGGQGVVYKVSIDGTNEEKALKWYHMWKVQNPEGFRKNLQQLVLQGSPSSAFIWPEALTEWVNGTFGYIMRIIPNDFKGFSQFLMSHARFNCYHSMVRSAINIAMAYLDLHNFGYNYQDLNDGNISINPLSGEVLVCDNDNVMGHGQYSGVLGKGRYMAPEVVRGERMPDKFTDRHSLAVILFLLLVGDHPLEGTATNYPCLTNKYETRAFGTDPLFIFDNNDKNRPIPGIHKNAISFWPYYPSYLHNAFKLAFSQESLFQPNKRLSEQAWFHTLVKLLSSIAGCPKCKGSLFLDTDRTTTCPQCFYSVQPAGYLRFARNRANIEISVPILEGVSLYDYHMEEGCNDCNTVAAKILFKPGKYGLQNVSNKRWTMITTDGSSKIKEAGDVVLLSVGTKVDFGSGNIAEVITNN